ncbi:hypothetical protein [Phyllobacterium sp. K27]
MKTITLLEIEDEVGFVFPIEIIAKYNLKLGDELKLVETKDGFQFTPTQQLQNER